MLVRLVLCTAVALLSHPSPAMADVPRDVCGIEIPPKRYDHKPAKAPIDGPHRMSAAAVALECVGSGEHGAQGCTTFAALRDAKGLHLLAARIVIASAPPPDADRRCTPAKWKESVLRHENAHAAGWPQNHPR